MTQPIFPYFLAEMSISLTAVRVYLKPKGPEAIDTSGLTLSINGTKDSNNWSPLTGVDPTKTNLRGVDVPISGVSPIGQWTIDVVPANLTKDELDDIIILLKYTADIPQSF